jgi:hypothetical protein
MIELPRRSVTRFFIPLIDVLTLLFCIYLLMPMVKSPADERSGPDPAGVIPDGAGAKTAGPADRLPGELEKEGEELRRLQKERIETLQTRLAIRVVEIDADTGKLYYHEPEARVEIGSEAEARALIDRKRREAAGKELYFLVLYPRRVTGFPTQKQVRQYERWLEGVAHGTDNPRASR